MAKSKSAPAKVVGEYAITAIDDDGNAKVFLPGERPPDWVLDQLASGGRDGAAHPFALVDSEGAQADEEPEIAEQSAGPPPQVGRGSSTAAWQDYALEHGVDVDDDMSRDEIIDACIAAGVPVE